MFWKFMRHEFRHRSSPGLPLLILERKKKINLLLTYDRKYAGGPCSHFPILTRKMASANACQLPSLSSRGSIIEKNHFSSLSRSRSWTWEKCFRDSRRTLKSLYSLFSNFLSHLSLFEKRISSEGFGSGKIEGERPHSR